MSDQRKKHFQLGLPLSLNNLRRIDNDELLGNLDGFIVVRKRGRTDTDRRQISDEAFVVPFNVLKQKIDEQVNDHATYVDIAERDADPQSSEPSSVSYVKNVSGDPTIGRNVWGMYIYDAGLADYVLFATEEDIFYIPENASGLVPNDIGTLQAVNGITPAQLSGLSFTKFIEEVLWNKRAYALLANSCALVINNVSSPLEVGTSTAWEVTATYVPGLINNGDDNASGETLTGVPIDYTYTDIDSSTTVQINTGLSDNYTASALPVTLGDNQMSVDVDYSQGSGIYQDLFGNPGLLNEDSKALEALRAAGNCIVQSPIIEAFYKMFFNIGSAVPVNSAQVRAAGASNFLDISSVGEFEFTVSAGDTQVWFSVPTGKEVTVKLKESSMGIINEFALSTFNVNDAGGAPISYDTYYQLIGGIGYANDVTYVVTIE